MPSSYCTITVADMTSRILDRLDNNTLLYTQAEITTALNEAVRTANDITGFLQGSSNITTVSGNPWYGTPYTHLIPLRLQAGNFYLQKTTIWSLAQKNPTWQMDTEASTGVGSYSWAPIGLKRFAVYPAPSEAYTLTVTSVIEPTLLVHTFDVLQIPPEYVDLLQDIAVHVLQLKEGGKIFQQSMTVYQRAVAKLREMSVFRRDMQLYYQPEAEQLVMK